MNQNELRKRTLVFLEKLNLPISRFAEANGFQRETYYKWIKGVLDFGEKRAEQIDTYLKQFGF